MEFNNMINHRTDFFIGFSSGIRLVSVSSLPSSHLFPALPSLLYLTMLSIIKKNQTKSKIASR